MAEQKTIITIEEKINDVLSGDTKKNALDFVAWLRGNELALDPNGDNGEGWAVGGIVGDSIGFMLVNGAPDCPGPWTIWFNSCDFGDKPADDELKETAWNHASPCGHCHAGWKDCGCGDRTIYGREFKELCHSPLMFTAPDAKTLENLERLILILKQK